MRSRSKFYLLSYFVLVLFARPGRAVCWAIEFNLTRRGRSYIMSTVAERVRNVVTEQLGVSADKVQEESSFVNDLGADSLDTVELVMALEEEFETEIPDAMAEKISTVRQAIDYIEANLEEKS